MIRFYGIDRIAGPGQPGFFRQTGASSLGQSPQRHYTSDKEEHCDGDEHNKKRTPSGRSSWVSGDVCGIGCFRIFLSS